MTSHQTHSASDDRLGLIGERATSEGLLLAVLGQYAMRRLRETHTAHNLSPRQFHLLGLLHDRGPTTQRELARLMGTDRSSLVMLLNPLDAAGFISRVRDKDDRRRHVVTLNPTGARQLDRAAQAQREVENELFAGLTDGQRHQLREILVIISDRLTPERKTDCTSSTPADVGP